MTPLLTMPSRSPRRIWGERLRVAALAVLIATAAQLAPLSWRTTDASIPYLADYDEMLYAAVVRHAVHSGPSAPNPFDAAWARATSPFGWMLPELIAMPVSLGGRFGSVLDTWRWVGSLGVAAGLMAIGSAAAAPSVGAAIAVLVLLDPGALSAKPLLPFLGIGGPLESSPHQLYFSRLYSPSLTLPFLLAALLTLMHLGGRHGATRWRAGVLAAFAALGATCYFFFWSAGLAALAAVALWGRVRRRAGLVLVLAPVLLLAAVLLNRTGESGTDLMSWGLRNGIILTHAPLLIRHTGFWAAGLAALWLAVGPCRARPAARALGRAYIGVWVLALVHTPLMGRDIQSFHYGLALGPLGTAVLCVVLWLVWRARARSRLFRVGTMGLVGGVALVGPFRAVAGAEAASAPVVAAQVERLHGYLASADMVQGTTVLVPRSLRAAVAVGTDASAFAHEYQMQWYVPDSVLWYRAVCSAALTGEDSAEVAAQAIPTSPGIPLWPYGWPSGYVTGRAISSADIRSDLAVLLGGALAAAQRSSDSLSRACADLPDLALVLGRTEVRRAIQAAAPLSASVRFVGGDSSAAVLLFHPR